VNTGARDTIPPVPFSSDDEYDEDLLDSLHLSPSEDDVVMVENPEPDALSFETEEPLEVVDEDDLGSSRRPARAGNETVASTPREAQDLRRRIARPLPDELDLEHIEEEEHEVEEISLEPPARPGAAAAAPTFRPYLEEDLRAPGRSARPAPAAAITPVPVSVDLVAGPGVADVSIPVEIVLNNGTAQVNLHVRLTLNLKLKQ
jgi:hypothetical protein